MYTWFRDKKKTHTHVVFHPKSHSYGGVFTPLQHFYANKTRGARVKASMDASFSTRLEWDKRRLILSSRALPTRRKKYALPRDSKTDARRTSRPERDGSANDHQPRTQSLTRSLQRCEFARRPIAHLRSHLEKEVPFASDACCAHTMSDGLVHARASARSRTHAQ